MARFREDTREVEKNSTRQRLLDAAVAEFAREGFAHANINTISESAGLGKGTVYNYFASKRELMLTAIKEVSDRHHAYIRARVVEQVDGLERLKAFYTSGFSFVEDYPAQARFLIGTMYGANEDFKQAIYTEYLWMAHLVGNEVLDYGARRGDFTIDQMTVTTGLLMTLYLGTVAVVNEDGRPFMRADDVYQFVVSSLKNRVDTREK